MKFIPFIIIILTLLSCNANTINTSLQRKDTVTTSCSTVSIAIKHSFPSKENPWNRTVTLPSQGKFVAESHYVTTKEVFEGKTWPSAKDEGIENHLKKAFEAYKKHDPKARFEELYASPWQKEWTPAEGGAFGQGSVGDVQLKELSTEMEMWLLTMMWAKGERPERGTKFLLSANDKSVVVIAGYETGPASQDFLGGITTEVHHWLNTTSDSEISIALLADQTLPPGPVNCK
jgi:hypothetical protein